MNKANQNAEKSISPSSLVLGNRAFRQGQYTLAVTHYQEVMSVSGEVARTAKFNLDQALKRIARDIPEKRALSVGDLSTTAANDQPWPLQSQHSLGIINEVESPNANLALTIPDDLDLYYFKSIEESKLFDSEWYLKQYQSTQTIIGNPLQHYLDHGYKLGNNPSTGFDTNYYLQANPDVADAGIHPFIHYLSQGIHENARRPLPPPPPIFRSHYQVAAPKYVPRLPLDAPEFEKTVRVIAFYLPQFHAIPENDTWWGKGFTEWSNVKPAIPQYNGHYQPHIPDASIGYYNLLDRQVQRQQVELAKQYGVEGFCFYLYWFSGQRLLEQPVDNYLADPSLDLPFCVCWANENWSRRWDGLDQDLLAVQLYSPEDDLNFIQEVAKYLRDPRYIRINGKPLLMVYRPSNFPNMLETAQCWRTWCLENGVGEIYLVYPQSFECVDPAIYGFDAATEFPPNNSAPPNITATIENKVEGFGSTVYDWRVFIERSEDYTDPGYKIFRGATPSWDNTARKKAKGTVFQNSCPKLFTKWLTNAFVDTVTRLSDPQEQIVFVNAWNEWAEGAHLEPDQRYGYAWLQALRDAHLISLRIRNSALLSGNSEPAARDAALKAKTNRKHELAVVVHLYYGELLHVIGSYIDNIPGGADLYFSVKDKNHPEVADEILERYPDAVVVSYPNHGRDVLPFLHIISHIVDFGYSAICKIHSKKSKHRGDGDIWRDDVFNKLLGSSEQISACRDQLENGVGILAPAGHLLDGKNYWGSNSARVTELAQQMDCPNEWVENFQFPAGTMFWFQPKAMRALLNLNLKAADFEIEAGQVDGTTAHAVERLVAFSARLGGFSISETQGERDENYTFAIRT